jgi:hypothetical protein
MQERRTDRNDRGEFSNSTIEIWHWLEVLEPNLRAIPPDIIFFKFLSRTTCKLRLRLKFHAKERKPLFWMSSHLTTVDYFDRFILHLT